MFTKKCLRNILNISNVIKNINFRETPPIGTLVET